MSDFNCEKCSAAKEMLENMSELEQVDLEWAIERKAFTDRYCANGCNSKSVLRFQDHIDLKDGLTINGLPAKIDINPSFILKDKELQSWLSFCSLADNGLFPQVGGATDQDTEFLEMYEIYCGWKNVTKKSSPEEV